MVLGCFFLRLLSCTYLVAGLVDKDIVDVAGHAVLLCGHVERAASRPEHDRQLLIAIELGGRLWNASESDLDGSQRGQFQLGLVPSPRCA